MAMLPVQFLTHIAKHAPAQYQDLLWGIREFYAQRGYLTERQAHAAQTSARFQGVPWPEYLVVAGQTTPAEPPQPSHEDEVPWPLLPIWEEFWDKQRK